MLKDGTGSDDGTTTLVGRSGVAWTAGPMGETGRGASVRARPAARLRSSGARKGGSMSPGPGIQAPRSPFDRPPCS